MNLNDGLIPSAEDLRQRVLVRAEAEGAEALHSHALTDLMIEELIEMGEIEEGQACFYRGQRREVSGYGIQDDDETLNLFITLYVERPMTPLVSVSGTDINKAFEKLITFFSWAISGDYATMEEASPAFDMVDNIYSRRKTCQRLRLYLITNGLARLEFKAPEKLGDLSISYHIWDVRRRHRYLTSGVHNEPIYIDFEQDFDCVIPCVSAPLDSADYESYLAILPGSLLGQIYGKYGPRILELNVRSFLQARGKINAGIRKTIKEEPTRFLAYNNGISATAEGVELVDLDSGGKALKAITGLQIVNGGQTTASIYHASKRDKYDISQVYVQMKLTVVQEKLHEIVPLISRFANSQNKVNEADFSANDPFHVRIEALSRAIWAPATDGTLGQTKWFYERAHGQYQDALGREGTAAKEREFKKIHPMSQRFTKTDLAKFENTWDQFPFLVSMGAQKNFREFALRLGKRGQIEPDEEFFKQHIAKALLFKCTEKIVSDQQFGGYRANIVTYSIAYLVNRTASRINLDRIWKEQNISPGLTAAIKLISHPVHESITSPPGGRNIGEWCKKKECWERILGLTISYPLELEPELLPLNGQRSKRAESGIEKLLPEEEDCIRIVSQVPATTWFEISNWAKETSQLASWQRSLAFSLGGLVARGKSPSIKQAVHGLKLLREAERLGYRLTTA